MQPPANRGIRARAKSLIAVARDCTLDGPRESNEIYGWVRPAALTLDLIDWPLDQWRRAPAGYRVGLPARIRIPQVQHSRSHKPGITVASLSTKGAWRRLGRGACSGA